MNRKSRHYPKPDLMVLITFFVGLGFLLTSVAQAEQLSPFPSATDHVRQHLLPEKWYDSLALAIRLRDWKPEIDLTASDDGLNLSRPFGIHGPSLQISTSVPERAERCLRAGGDSQVGALSNDRPDAYLFLQKRW